MFFSFAHPLLSLVFLCMLQKFLVFLFVILCVISWLVNAEKLKINQQITDP